MSDIQAFSVLTLRLRQGRHVVDARQRARDIAALLGFEHQEQIRLATAASEIARNAFRYAMNGEVEYRVMDGSRQMFVMSVKDTGPGIPDLPCILNGQYISKTGLGKGIAGTKRLMDHFRITSSSAGTHVEMGKAIPFTAPRIDAERIRRIANDLAKSRSVDPFDEVERQNQELLKTLAELEEKQQQLAELNQELEDTNRGVVALYAELDQHADDLRKVSDLKTSFLSNLSHEFRTPLNSISSLCNLLLNRADGELSVEQEQQVSYIRLSASELTELVNDLLDLAKVEAGKIEVKPKHFDVRDLFAALQAMLKPLLSGNSLNLVIDSGADLPPLFTDEAKVSQILRNLISNALKFTRRGFVRLAASADPEGFISFSVSDTGIGISPGDLDRIFEEFVQIESELQRGVKGTGLGLPLSRRLAELLGGTITVQSTPGVGSTFTVRLPTHVRTNRQKPKVPVVLPNEGTGPVILFIDDNEETSFVHKMSLRGANYRLIFTSNLIEARTVLKDVTPSVVALDRFLDSQDSLFFIKELKENGYSGSIVVISVVDDPTTALEAGADAFLAKPVAPFTLANTMRELILGRASSTILLVDDDEVTRYVLADALAKLGYRILEARNGREAIQLAQSRIPKLMVLDIIMPDLDGFEVLREIRSDPSTCGIQVLVHTSKDLSDQETEQLAQMNAAVYPERALNGEGNLDDLGHVLDLLQLKP